MTKVICVPKGMVSGPPGYWITLIDTPLVVILGLLGNCLSILVMQRKQFETNATSIFIVALSAADSVFLLTNQMTNLWFQIMTCFSMRESSLPACKVLLYIVYVSKAFAAWLIVSVSFERMLMVLKPLRAKVLFTVRRTKIWIFVLLCLMVVFYAYIPVMADIHDGEDCDFALNRTYVGPFLMVFDLMIFSVVPSCILFVCNSVLYYTLRVKKRMISQDMDGPDSLRFTATLIAVSVCHVILTLPMTVFHVVDISRFPKQRDNTLDTTFILLYSLNLYNNAINFLLYCLSGPTFRLEMRRMCLKRSCYKRLTPDPENNPAPSLQIGSIASEESGAHFEP